MNNKEIYFHKNITKLQEKDELALWSDADK